MVQGRKVMRSIGELEVAQKTTYSEIFPNVFAATNLGEISLQVADVLAHRTETWGLIPRLTTTNKVLITWSLR